MYLETVDWAISNSSLSSSPWMRGAPHNGLSLLIRWMNSRAAHGWSRIRSCWGVSCISEVVWEFARLEGFECASDPIIECGKRSFLGLAQMRLDFGKALLDRIEIGTVGRQIAQCSVHRFDDLAHPISLVSRQVIDDDDVAWPQRRRQAFLQIFDEDRTVHRAIDDERSGEAIKPKPGHKGHGLPVAPRNAADNPATALGPSEKPRHLGRCPGLINEDQLGRI